MSNLLKRANTAASTQNFINEARKLTWRDIQITDNDKLKITILMKHGTLTKAAKTLSVNYVTLSHVISGRRYPIEFIRLLQSDLGLSDDQVLELWPLLKTWPKKSRIIA